MNDSIKPKRPSFIDAATIVERMADASAFGARLEDDPGDVLADARLESIHRNEGNWPALIELLIDRAEVASETDAIEILSEVASIYENEVGDLESARVVSLATFDRDPTSADVATTLDRLAYKTGQWDEVIDAYMMAAGKLAQDEPDTCGALWLRIACAHLMTTGDMGAVSEALERVHSLETQAVGPYLDMVAGRVDSLALLDTLVELCRRVGDDERRTKILSRAIAVATDSSTKARYHLAIGDLAETREEPEAARWHYTEALRLDPRRAGAREALVAMYRGAGNQRELAKLLASSRFTASQTEKANVALEAASIYADELDENTRAINLYAFAFSQDPGHVDAALPLAERYYQEKRWHELGPILDLLISSEGRLGPDAPDITEVLHQRAQCAMALGDFAKARECCEKSIELDGQVLDVHHDLAMACTELGDHDGACNAHNQVLVLQRNSKASAKDRSLTLSEMARTRRAVGDDDAALTLFESGLDLAFSQDAFAEVREIYERKAEWGALVSCARIQLDRAGLDDKGKVALLSVIAEVIGSHQGDAHGAIESYERAHNLDPDDRSVLHQLIEYYGAAEMWEQAVHSMRKVASMETDTVRKGKYYQAAATIARHHLDVDRAAALYEDALECFFDEGAELPAGLRASCMKAFTDLARVLHGAGKYKALERAYRQMIRRMRAGDAELPELWHGLGQVYRKYLRKTEEAIESFEVASSLDSDRSTHQQILIDLYRNSPAVSADQIDKAIERRQHLIELEPFAAEHYRELRSLYLRSNRHDEAWTAARALVFLDAADSAEAEDYQLGRAASGKLASGQLSPADWGSLRNKDEDDTITTIMALVAEAVSRDSALPARKLGLRNDPNPLFDHLRRMFVGVTSALGLPAYELCVQPEISGDVLLANVRRGRRLAPTFAIGRALYDGQSVESINYTLGRALSYGRPEYLLRLVLPGTAELEAVFLAASSLSRSDVPITPSLASHVAHYQALLNRRLGAEWKRALGAAVEAFVAKGRPFCLETWGNAVDATARRDGLLLSGDLTNATEQLSSEPRFARGGQAESKIADLVSHSVSATHQRLRAKLGLAMPTNDIARSRRNQL